MYTFENYIWGLVAYVVGVLLLLPVIWKITGYIDWRPVRIPLRLLFIALLLTPVTAYVDTWLLAPAWVVAAFEAVQPSSEEGAIRALLPMVLVFLLLLAIYYGAIYGYNRWRHRAQVRGK